MKISNPIKTCCIENLNLKILRYVAGLLIFLAILIKVHLVFCLNINWDEFHYLSFVYSYLDGSALFPLQTFHVHFFSWLPLASSNEINQIIIARCLLLLISIGSGILVYKIGRIYLGKEGALFSALCYFSYYNIMLHGNSFRMDPICCFLFLSSLYLVLGRTYSYNNAIIAGILMGLSLMITIKSSIYLLSIALLYFINIRFSSDKIRILKHASVFVVTLLLSAGLFYSYHIFSITSAGTALAYSAPQNPGQFYPRKVQSISPNYLYNVFSKMFLENGFIPRLAAFKKTVYKDAIIWLCLIIGIISTFKEIQMKNEKSLMLRQLLPLLILPLTVVFYRNAWPYYYVFIIPPVLVYCGMVVDRIVSSVKSTKSTFSWWMITIMFLSVFCTMVPFYANRNSNETTTQRKLVNLVHEIFPKPTPYIDGCSMISAYPKIGFFMTSWGVEEYRKRNIPIYRDLISKHHPAFLIANRNCIDPQRMIGKETTSEYELLEKDKEIILQNYVKHWGGLYVAGKKFEFSNTLENQQFEILIPGIYTVESDAIVSIDGEEYKPGSQVMLKDMNHNICAMGKPTNVILRWGKNLYRPDESTYSKLMYPL
jgi:hypothetical protein